MTDTNDIDTSRTALADVFGPPNKQRQQRRSAELLHRAALVTEYGWDQFRHQWSTGEVIGTALVLHDRAELIRHGETVDSALARWAFDLWGIKGGQADLDAGCPATRTWFDSLRARYMTTRPTGEIQW